MIEQGIGLVGYPDLLQDGQLLPYLFVLIDHLVKLHLGLRRDTPRPFGLALLVFGCHEVGVLFDLIGALGWLGLCVVRDNFVERIAGVDEVAFFVAQPQHQVLLCQLIVVALLQIHAGLYLVLY